MREIYIGQTLISDNALKKDETYLYETMSLISETLTADEFDFVAYGTKTSEAFLVTEGEFLVTEGEFYVINTGSVDLSVTYGTPVTYYENGTLIGKYYVYEVEQLSKTSFKFVCYSAVGLLIHQKHFGGIYSGERASDVISDILWGQSYSVETSAGNVLLYGHLPIQSKRDALRDVCFAIGANVFKDPNGDIFIKFNKDYTPSNIPDNRVYKNNRSFKKKTYATTVNVTEFSYYALPSDPTITLFDNTGLAAADNLLIEFDNPCHDLDFGTLTEVESGANYAIVSGNGTLTGQEYTVRTQTISKTTNSDAVETRQVNVSDNHLISGANSRNVLARVSSYYSMERELKSDIVVNGEICGSPYNITGIDGTKKTGYLTSLDSLFSSVRKATGKFVLDWSPSNFGNNFENYVILTGSGSWDSSVATGAIRVVLGGSGAGGQGGQGGENSGYFNSLGFDPAWTKTEENNGGAGGQGGSGGKVLIVDIDSPSGSYSYNCGTGGAGGAGTAGADTPSEGASGGASVHTTFGIYDSNSGDVLDGGYINPLATIDSEKYFSMSGSNGYNGANGKALSDGFGEFPTNGDDFTDGVNTWTGGGVGTSTYNAGRTAAGTGGSGGGAAYGANGGAGSNGYQALDSQYIGGDGGSGASAASPAYTLFLGAGGNGGHGGGGGGYGGIGFNGGTTTNSGAAGQGGAGSNGSSGGNGYIIVFY